MLNLNDKQDNIAGLYLTSRCLEPSSSSFGPPGQIEEAQESLCLFGTTCCHFLMPFICVSLSLEDELECLSYLTHLTLAL